METNLRMFIAGDCAETYHLIYVETSIALEPPHRQGRVAGENMRQCLFAGTAGTSIFKVFDLRWEGQALRRSSRNEGINYV
jgi:hypothetical protein